MSLSRWRAICFRSVDGTHGDAQIVTLPSCAIPLHVRMTAILMQCLYLTSKWYVHSAHTCDRYMFITLSLFISCALTPRKVQVTQSVYSTAYDAMYTTYRRNWSLSTHRLDRLCRARDRGRRAMRRWVRTFSFGSVSVWARRRFGAYARPSRSPVSSTMTWLSDAYARVSKSDRKPAVRRQRVSLLSVNESVTATRTPDSRYVRDRTRS